VGGIDPVVRGADPEFSGKNAVAISEVTDGYWIFYEGPTYTKQDHAEYWKWFTWANRAIAAGNYDAQYEPRQAPEVWQLELLGQITDRVKRRIVPPPVTGQVVKLPFVRMRSENLVILACKAGQEVRLAVKDVPVGRYDSDLVWQVRGPHMTKLAEGKVPHKGSGTICFNATSNGLHMLMLSAGGCSYTITASNVPVGLCAADGLRLIGPARRLYFAVPKGVQQFSITVQGSGAETVRLKIIAPSGEPVAETQTTREQNEQKLRVPVAPHGSGIWAVQLGRAETGVLEDHRLKLHAPLLPIVTLLPEHVFTSKPEK